MCAVALKEAMRVEDAYQQDGHYVQIREVAMCWDLRASLFVSLIFDARPRGHVFVDTRL